MATLARSSSPKRDELDADFGVGDFAYAPGDALGGPPRRRRSNWGKRLLLLGLMAGGGALQWYAPAVLSELASTSAQLIASALQPSESRQVPDLPKLSLIDPRSMPERPAVASVDVPASAPQTRSPAEATPVSTRNSLEVEKSQAAGETKGTAAPVAPVTTGALPAQATGTEPGQAPPPPAYVDPLQKRAERIGLHPDLSSAILKGLTEADFRSAEASIRAALTQTAETAVYLSPKPERDSLARFKVHFVAGAEAGCRRYVVTIIKKGWEATALPMERCGIKKAGLARN